MKQWRAVASRKGFWNNRRRNLATVPEILQGAARLNDGRSATGRIYASSSTCFHAFASADTIRFTVSVAEASSRQLGASRRPELDLRRSRQLSLVVPDQLSLGQ